MTTATQKVQSAQEKSSAKHEFVQGVHGVRYQTQDVARAVAF